MAEGLLHKTKPFCKRRSGISIWRFLRVILNDRRQTQARLSTGLYPNWMTQQLLLNVSHLIVSEMSRLHLPQTPANLSPEAKAKRMRRILLPSFQARLQIGRLRFQDLLRRLSDDLERPVLLR
jgi:hypothetical protein